MLLDVQLYIHIVWWCAHVLIQVCGVLSSCIPVLSLANGTTPAYQNTWIGPTMTILSNNYEGQACVACCSCCASPVAKCTAWAM